MMKPLITHWRASGILIALYLDDGFCVIPSETNDTEFNLKVAKEVSKHVKIDLLRAGLIYNVEKSQWVPSSRTVWLGMTWDTVAGTLHVLQRRVDQIILSISVIQQSEVITIRRLHSFVDQVISLSPICGGIT